MTTNANSPDGDAADAALTDECLSAQQLEEITGTPASTWRYFAHIETGPASFKIGRRRVWKKSTFMAWLAAQEAASQ